MPKLTCFKTTETDVKLYAQVYCKVVSAELIIPGTPQCWIIEYRLDGVQEPDAEPLIIGAQSSGNSVETRVIWRGAIWRPATIQERIGMKRLADSLTP